LRFRVLGLELSILGFRISGSRVFRVKGLQLRIYDLGLRVQRLGFGVNLGLRVEGSWLRVHG
jgi:hypothetical protein